MRVGLVDVDAKMPNVALMKLSSYHRGVGDDVCICYPLNSASFDKIYASSLFDFSDKSWVPRVAECGGTGYDIGRRLLDVVDSCQPDYSLYPGSRVTMQRYSTGCIRDCPFCVVREKEGNIKPCDPMNMNPRGEWVHLLDNNFFASPNWEESIQHLLGCNQPIDFEGVDARLLTDKMAHYLNLVRCHKQIKMAWDNPKLDMTHTFRNIASWIKPYKVMVYVLIGYWSTPEEDLWRVRELASMGFDPFVMPYNKNDAYQRMFARWVNHKAIFKSTPWAEYSG